MIYPFECLVCGKKFEIVQQMNKEHRFEHCGKEARRIWTVPHTSKDLLYDFTADFGKEKVDIHSRRQFKKLKKKHGLADCTWSEALSVKPKTDHKEKARKLAKKCVKEIVNKGGMNWVLGKENPNGPDKRS